MKVSYPHMDSPVLYYKLLTLLGHEVVVPPRPTQKTISLGVKYAPEFACFPLKMLLGTYLEAEELGADTIVTSGGHGPCRAGLYGQLHQKIIDSMGLDLDIIVFDAPTYNWRDFLKKVNKIKLDNSWFKLANIINITYRLAHSMDRIEKQVHSQRAYAVNPQEVTNLWDEIQDKYMEIETRRDIKKTESWAKAELAKLDYKPVSSEDKYKIGVIGEIYVVMEGSTNNDIEEMLNRLGCEVERSHYISEYIDSHLVPWKKKEFQPILDKADEYLEIQIGGHAKMSVGHIVDYKERGFDGVIHLKPFGCLPELISQSMLDKISDDLNIPILSLSIDEQMAKANTLTRVEAFLDLVKQKKQQSKEGIV
ncbi:MAG: 2-hydroxyacyl-CoA dehydratase [Bacillota bacterium]